jgi:hypothetical protein
MYLFLIMSLRSNYILVELELKFKSAVYLSAQLYRKKKNKKKIENVEQHIYFGNVNVSLV